MLEMRKRILEIVPDAQEVVSYGMPAFKVDETGYADILKQVKDQKFEEELPVKRNATLYVDNISKIEQELKNIYHQMS